jgi:hypothetical protein
MSFEALKTSFEPLKLNLRWVMAGFEVSRLGFQTGRGLVRPTPRSCVGLVMLGLGDEERPTRAMLGLGNEERPTLAILVFYR